LGLQWQWFGNYQDEWVSCVDRPGFLRMNAVSLDKEVTLFERPNLLLQKIPAERFTATARFDAAALGGDESAGLLVTGSATAALQIHRENDGIRLTRTTTVTPLKAKESKPAEQVATTMPAPSSSPGRKFFPGPDVEDASIVISGTVVYLRVSVKPSGPPGDPKKLPKAVCGFSYSSDGVHYSELGKPCAITDNGWIGAKLGLFCNGKATMPGNRAGHADVDWFRFAPNE
jgi:hypothetical protein